MTKEEELKKLELEELSLEEEKLMLEKKSLEGPSFADKAIEYGGKALHAVDSVTGAPIRSAIMAGMKGEPIVPAYMNQFASTSHDAPSGKDMAAEAGLSTEEYPIPIPTTEQSAMPYDMAEQPQEQPTVGVSPAGAAGAVIDQVADPFILAGAGIKVGGKILNEIPIARRAIKTFASRQAIKALSAIPSSAEKASFIEKNLPEIAGQAIMEEGLGKHLNNPKKLLEEINGKESVSYQTVAGKDLPKKSRQSGLIGKISDETDDIINQINAHVGPIDVSAIANDLISNNRRMRLDPSKAESFSPSQMKKYEKTVNEILLKNGQYKPQRTLEQLQSIKRDLGSKLKSKDFFAPANEAQAFEKEVMTDMFRAIKDKIENITSQVPINVSGKRVMAGDIIKINNHKLSSLMDVRSLLESIPAKELSSPGLSQKIADIIGTTATGVGTYGVTNNPFLAVGAAGGYSKITGAAKRFSSGIPAMEANLADRLLKGEVMPRSFMGKSALGMGAASKLLPPQHPNREPQSIPEELVRKKFPRTSQAIIDHKDFILAKLAQQSTEMFDPVKDMIELHPEQIKDAMPALVMQFPQLFEHDIYNRFDGKILDPKLKEMARKDIMDDDKISNTEKAILMNRLNKKGEY